MKPTDNIFHIMLYETHGCDGGADTACQQRMDTK